MGGEAGGAVGLRIVDLVDPGRQRWDGTGPRPLRTYLWYPAETSDAPPLTWSEYFAPANVVRDAPPRGGRRPTILFSHGTGGSSWQLGWLAERLVAAGFVALAVDHHGNNERDPYLPEGFICIWERPRDLSYALDALSGEGLIDPSRVGAAGFSLGGYTAAALLGARIDAARFRGLLNEGIDPEQLPEFPDLLDALRTRLGAADFAALPDRATVAVGDDRVRAALLLAPAIGPFLSRESLAAITRPVAVYWGAADTVAPPAENGEVYARTIPSATGASVGAAAGHPVFFSEGSDLGRREAPQFCTDPPGIDRHAVHERISEEAVAFFRRALGAG